MRHSLRKWLGWIAKALASCTLILSLLIPSRPQLSAATESSQIYQRSTYSSPIALSADNQLVWAVIPEQNQVAVIRTDTHQLLTVIDVGQDPESVALDPNNKFAYVANAADSNVTFIKISNANPSQFSAAVDRQAGRNGTVTTGAEPQHLVVSPDGRRLFVSNSGQDTITVINTQNQQVIGNIDLRHSLCNVGDHNRHFQPHGLAVTQDNSLLYVTRFLSFTKPGGVQGSDLGREGVVCRLNIDTHSDRINSDAPAHAIKLAAQDTGFSIDANDDGVADPTAAFPNQLNSIVIRGDQAYLPNIAASPSRPLQFDVNTQAFVNRIDRVGQDDIDAGALNLHLGARVAESGKKRLFFANPWAIAFTTQSGTGNAYAVSAGSDLLVKLNVNHDGVLSFTNSEQTTRYIDLNDPNNAATKGDHAGKNPIGIAINDAGTVAYVNNYISRNISIVDLENDAVAEVVRISPLPTPGSREEVLLAGGEMFFSSRGNFIGGFHDRLSSEGWQNCASCHFKGLTDSVIWQFNTGPRKSLPLNASFNPHDRNEQRILNYSAIFDELQDWETNIRNISGPGGLHLQGKPPVACSNPTVMADSPGNIDPAHGLLIGDDGDPAQAPCEVNAFRTLANAKRPQHKILLPKSDVPINALDALGEWVRYSVRTPNGPLTTTELVAGNGQPEGGVNPDEIAMGRSLFHAANCQSCHTGGKWSRSTKDFISPPRAMEIARERDLNGPDQAPNPNRQQYLPRFLKDVKSFNLNVPGSGNAITGQMLIGAVEKDAANNDALGLDYNNDGKGAGYNIPSILGIHASPPYYHNGACETLDCVVADIHHRRAGLTKGQHDPLDSASARSKLVTFLESIDLDTPPP